ncbi:MAG: aromatic ring-hydroxylating dioxygenase subunit alpha, partial [Pigmentiphaga sp.]
NDAGVTAPGASRAEGSGIYGLHLLTPVNERRTAYHFAAVRQNPQSFDDEVEADIMASLTALRRKAFVTEDLPMIEAQQRNVDRMRTPVAPVLLDVDSGAVRYRRILNRLLAEDKAP